VMLKVRFAEMQRAVTKALRGGLNVQIPGTDGSLSFGGGGGNASGAGFAALPGSQGGAIGSIGIGDVQLAVMLQALETRGVIRTLAEPNLVALSGQEAKFLAGGEFPIPIAQRIDDDGFARITV